VPTDGPQIELLSRVDGKTNKAQRGSWIFIVPGGTKNSKTSLSGVDNPQHERRTMSPGEGRDSRNLLNKGSTIFPSNFRCRSVSEISASTPDASYYQELHPRRLARGGVSKETKRQSLGPGGHLRQVTGIIRLVIMNVKQGTRN